MIKKDKILHFSISLVLTFGIGFFGEPFIGGWSKILAVFSVLVIGAVKEVVYDKYLQKGTPEVYDFIADLTGCGAGLLILHFV